MILIIGIRIKINLAVAQKLNHSQLHKLSETQYFLV